MGLIRNDEHDRPLNYTRTKSITRLFDELLQNVSSNGSGSTIKTRDKGKSPAFTNEAPLPSNSRPSPPPMEASMASGSKHTSNILTQRILEGLQSQYHHQPHEASPTDSHPRSRSRSRHRSSRSSETISALLLIATERLTQETSRANEAERQASEVLAHFKIAHQAKQKLEIDLQRVKDELGLYKTQLDIAQAEIRRAQEIVNKVDQQRADAEDEARRGREKVRKLTEARSIELAMEEGRRLGYEEGMRQGRLMAQARDADINQPIRYYRRTSLRSARDDDDDQISYFSYTQEERRSSESFQSPTNPSTSVRSLSRHRRTSDARQSAPPISPNSTPRPSHNRVPSSTSKHDNNPNHPEDIAVQPHLRKDSNPTRPLPTHNHSPTISHRSSKLPDGYIPTLGANSVISLPPPHGLSTPIHLNGVSQPSVTAKASDSKQANKQASTSRSSEYIESRKRTAKSADGDSISHYRDSISNYTLSRQRHINKRNSRPTHAGAESEASGPLSTRISESSLLGPPDDIGRSENRDEGDYFNQGMTIRSESRASSTQPERIAAKWRCVNPDIRAPSLSPSPGQSTFLDGYNELTARMQGNFTIERPTSTSPAQRSQPRLSPRRPREIVLPSPSRRPREIVLPGPLIGTLLNSNNIQNLDRAAQETADHQENANDRSLSPGYRDTRPQFLLRSTSNITVPGIEIVTPSSHTSTLSGRTTIDPVLLTPESANRQTPLPQIPTQTQSTTETPTNSSLGLYFNQQQQQQPSSTSISNDEPRITMVLPDNNLPAGFIPLSPIPGMTNLDSYPSGFAPSVPKLQDEYPGGRLPSNFSYPSSPLIRSGV